MEAVCCWVRKLVTSLSLFFLATLKVSHSLLSISHLYLFLRLSLTHTLRLFFFRSPPLQPLFCPRRHPRLLLLESWPSAADKNSVPVWEKMCVCVCVSASSSVDEIWVVKYECWLMFWCHIVVSLVQEGVVKMGLHTPTHTVQCVWQETAEPVWHYSASHLLSICLWYLPY